MEQIDTKIWAREGYAITYSSFFVLFRQTGVVDTEYRQAPVHLLTSSDISLYSNKILQAWSVDIKESLAVR